MGAKQLTIRNVSPELGSRLSELSKAQGLSVNSFVLDVLKKAAGISDRRLRLRRYMTWTIEERDAFEAVLRTQREVDEAAWR